MTDQSSVNKKRPTVAVSVVIYNKINQVFLMRSPAWNNLLVMPGGGIDWKESAEQAGKREVFEETGLKVKNLRFVRIVEMLNDPNYQRKVDGEPKHIVALDYVADLDGEDQVAKLDGQEAIDYLWLTVDEVLKRDDIEPATRETVKIFHDGHFGKEKKNIFNRDCKKCPDTKKECEEYKTGWQRALADYKNLQTETEKRRGEWVKMSEAQILEEFIPVYDNFKKAFAVSGSLPLPAGEIKRGWEQWAQGIEYIKKQFGDILKNHGVEEIKTIGEKFDPNLHESVGAEEVEGKEHGEILKEITGGYMAHGKVLWAARVIISK